ncbi:MAG: hypothetical protein LBK99_08895 [Opitutaceae bacterium]|nr:hypothetical protein [Opitutaceae bacterium]
MSPVVADVLPASSDSPIDLSASLVVCPSQPGIALFTSPPPPPPRSTHTRA